MKLANQKTIEFLIEKYRLHTMCGDHDVSREQFYADIIRARRADFFGNTCAHALFGIFVLLLVLLPRGSISHPAFYWPFIAAFVACFILRLAFNPHFRDSHENMEQIWKHMRTANGCLSHSPDWELQKAALAHSGIEAKMPLDVYVARVETSGKEQTGMRTALDALWFETDTILKRETSSVSGGAKKRIRESTQAFIAFGLVPDDTDQEAILTRLNQARHFG